jgi:phage tail-like protein
MGTLPSDPVPFGKGAEDYPLPAFCFSVVFTGLPPGSDTSFQEVKGIGAELDLEEVVEGGENRFVHRLPKAAKHPQLELKRGIAPANSPLVKWCQGVLEGGLNAPVRPQLLNVYLLDAEGDTVRAWEFANAWPVKWDVEDFKSTKNDVAIETIVLSYTWSNRTL